MDYYKNTSTEQLIRSMAESSDLYDPNLAGNTVLGENYVNMLAKLKQDNIDTSAFDKNSVYQYLSDDNKINYIWNKYFNEDSVDKQTKDAEFANIAKFEQQRQVYEGMSGIGKVFTIHLNSRRPNASSTLSVNVVSLSTDISRIPCAATTP